MKIVWHPLALEDLKQIIDYCLLNFGLLTARKVHKKYKAAIERLKFHPYIGVKEGDLSADGLLEYRSITEHNTKIIYTVHESYIFIHLLWNSQRAPETLQKDIIARG